MQFGFKTFIEIHKKFFKPIKINVNFALTDDAWVSGPDLAPQKFLLSQ